MFSTGIDSSDVKSKMSLWQVIINEDYCGIEEGSIQQDKGKCLVEGGWRNITCFREHSSVLECLE